MTNEVYKIGAVAAKTGLSVERIRAWERRYDLNLCNKVNGTRYYKKPALLQLGLIKELLDEGHSLGELTKLTLDDLTELSSSVQVREQSGSTPASSLILVGFGVSELEKSEPNQECRILKRINSLDEFEDQLDELPDFDDVDGFVLEISSLDVDRIISVRDALRDSESPEKPVLVLFHHASTIDIETANTEKLVVRHIDSTRWADVVEHMRTRSQVVALEDNYLYSADALNELSRAKSKASLDPSDLVKLIWKQRALIAHVVRKTESASDLTISLLMRQSEDKLELALQELAQEHQLFSEEILEKETNP